jgi:predicted DNA-binding WGR domain protein
MSKTLINIDPSVNARKFWSVSVTDTLVTFTWGRIGTRGQTLTKNFATPGAARAAAFSKLQSKLDKGYVALTSTWRVA